MIVWLFNARSPRVSKFLVIIQKLLIRTERQVIIDEEVIMTKQIGDLILYDVDELSEILGVHAITIRKYLREGKIHARKLARRWYVTEENMKEYFMNIKQE